MVRLAALHFTLAALSSCTAKDMGDLIIRKETTGSTRFTTTEEAERLAKSDSYRAHYAHLSVEELTQIYFTDLFFYKDDQTLNTEGVNPQASDWVYFFRNGTDSWASHLIGKTAEETVPLLTGGAHKAIYAADPEKVPTDYPGNPFFAFQFVELDTPGRAQSGGIVDISHLMLRIRKPGPFVPPDLENWHLPEVARHEMAHLMGAWKHSSLPMTIMNPGWKIAMVFQDFEVAAWNLFFQQPNGTTLESLKANGTIASDIEEHIKPHIIRTSIVQGDRPSGEGAVGEVVSIEGIWLAYRWGCDAAAEKPTITFNGVAATEVSVENCGEVRAVVPAGATSGPLVVTAYGKSSEGFSFTVE